MVTKKNNPNMRQNSSHYQDIGSKGGKTTASSHGSEFYQEIGHKGGKKRAKK